MNCYQQPPRRLPTKPNQGYDLDEYNEFLTFVKSINPDCFVRFNQRSGMWSELANVVHEETGTVVKTFTHTCDARKLVLNLARKLNRTFYMIDVNEVRPSGWRMHLDKSELDADMLFTDFYVGGLDLKTLREMCQ